MKKKKIVREKVEEHKQKEVVKQRELQGLHNRAVSTLEETKQEKQHLREENERLKQELRSVKIQLSKQPSSERAQRAFLGREAGNSNLNNCSNQYGPPKDIRAALQDSFHFMFTIMDNQGKFSVGHGIDLTDLHNYCCMLITRFIEDLMSIQKIHLVFNL